MNAVCLLFLLLGAQSAAIESVEIKGRVLDMQTGQPIEKARVSSGKASTVTRGDGAFTLVVSTNAGSEISVSAVGYGVARKTLASGQREIEFLLGQDAVKHAESVDVQAGVFARDRDAPTAQVLQSVELRNLSNVVADDALRSVQGLPGVVAGDDFYADFSLRGWGFEKTGLYIDGVLMSSPFHTIRDVNDGYSLTILNNDAIDGVTLINGGAPAMFGDRVGGALRIETRDGNREDTTVRATLGAAGVSFFAEGPLGHSGTSWLFGARKSFLDYVVNALEDQPSFVVGYYDFQTKLTHRAGAHTFSLFMLHGDSDYRDDENGLSRNDVARASAGTNLVSLRWRIAPSSKTSLVAGGFFSRETGANRNSAGESLFDSASKQSGLRIDFTRELNSTHLLQAGVIGRRLQGDVTSLDYPRIGPGTSRALFDAQQWQPGGYLQDGFRTLSERLTLTAGVRFDRSGALDRSVVLPRGSGSVRLFGKTTLSFAAGAYAQFPSFDQLYGDEGNAHLTPERSDHFVIALEQAVSSTTRVRLEAYDQEESDRLALSQEIRRRNGQITLPANPILENAWSGRSKGIEFTLQRRSPNGVTGWFSYAFGHTTLTDSSTGETFDSDHDQRHTVNAYASYRLSHRTNLSLKFRYGSNAPIVGYFETTADGYAVSEHRNRLRIPAYSRLDLRANRTFNIGRARLTAYAEIINVLNHSNYRYSGASIFLPAGRAFFDRDTSFPFLPAAGITVEW